MDMLMGEDIAAADLTDWRELAQELHARYVVGDFGTGARFVAAVGEAGDALHHHPQVAMGEGHVDLKLVSDDAAFRNDDEQESPHQRFHVEVYVTPEVVESRIAAAIAAGGTVVDDTQSPSLTVIADQDGNTEVIWVGMAFLGVDDAAHRWRAFTAVSTRKGTAARALTILTLTSREAGGWRL